MIKKSLFVCLVAIISVLNADVIINDPSETIYIKVSNHSVNRIVFPSKILAKQYSKEKGLLVKTFGNEAYLKYAPMKETVNNMIGGKTTTQPATNKIIYNKSKTAEVFFITEDTTYAIVFKPKKIKPQTIRINDTLAKKKSTIKYETRDPYKLTLKKIASMAHTNKAPKGFDTIPSNEKYTAKNLVITKEKTYIGTLYNVHKYTIHNTGDKAITLEEKNYISLAENEPLFISTFYKKQLTAIAPLDSASLVIVTHGGN